LLKNFSILGKNFIDFDKFFFPKSKIISLKKKFFIESFYAKDVFLGSEIYWEPKKISLKIRSKFCQIRCKIDALAYFGQSGGWDGSPDHYSSWT
jgi:hypothetical protein